MKATTNNDLILATTLAGQLRTIRLLANLKRKKCGFCGRYAFSPCGNATEADYCGRAVNIQSAYAIANSTRHPQRGDYAVMVVQYSVDHDLLRLQERIEAKLN